MKIAIIGYGKMGKAIGSLAETKGHQVTAVISGETKNQWHLLKDAEVAIEFTNPESATNNLLACLQYKLPVVTGSTGWYKNLPEITKRFQEEEGSLLYAPNFSIGVNLFMAVNELLARLMNAQPGYSARLEETHHTQKLDAPSGTAIALAEQLTENIGRYERWALAEAVTPEGVLPVTALREDNIPGTHVVEYQSESDIIQLSHRALNRAGFASGALIAAEWIRGKQGVFTMKDVLNLNEFA